MLYIGPSGKGASVNPFVPPSDEQVFSMRQVDKEMKDQLKEQR